MATKNYPYMKNVAATNVNQPFPIVWAATRMMKKAGWKVFASANGTTKDTTGDPALDKWNGTAGVVGDVTNAGASGTAVVGTPARGRATITGLTGIVAADKGRFIKITGSSVSANNNVHQIEEIVSSTSVKIDARTFAVAADATGRDWEIRDPQSDTYPSGTLSTAAAWWAAQGPSTMKIPITSNTSGRFIRGENVIQATTGAEGEFTGKYWDSVSSTGYLVIVPRVRGTGADPRGWETTYTITGSSSGATATQVGTAKEFVRQHVFYKAANETTGIWFNGVFDLSDTSSGGDGTGSTAPAFSLITTAAGCTATVPPGGGGTGNSLPTHGAVTYGTSNTSGNFWNRGEAGTVYGVGCTADCIEEEDYSADGSWTFGISCTQSAGYGHWIYSFQALEDSEPGDIDPYITMGPGKNTALYTNNRTGAAYSTSFTNNSALSSIIAFTASVTIFNGWRRKSLPTITGVATGDVYTEYDLITPFSSVTSGSMYVTNPTFPWKVSNTPNLPIMLFKIPFVSTNGLLKTVKGYAKWLRFSTAGMITQTYQDDDDSTIYWLQMANQTQVGVTPMCIGPWSGDTDVLVI